VVFGISSFEDKEENYKHQLYKENFLL